MWSGEVVRSGWKAAVAMMSDQLMPSLKKDLHMDFVQIIISVTGFCAAVYCLEYVDADYGLWLSWLLTPLLITFLLPGFLIILIYTSSVIFHIYKLYRQRLVGDLRGDWREASRQVVSALWDAHGWLWHGYEISGLENLPDEPCLVIYYHGALPVDMYYFISRMYLHRRRLIHTVADRILFKIPGWAIVMDAMCVIPGTVATCAGVLRMGNILAISPGGVYEAQFGDPAYQLCWRNRIGFAKVAIDAKVPIVPMFTQNVREAFRTVGWLRGLWLRVYTATHIPLAPVYGGFPVKLITHLGPPIPYDPEISAHDLQRKVAAAIEDLIEKHQRRPSSILRALVERVYRVPKTIEASKVNEATKADAPRANGMLPPESNDSAEGTDVRKNEKIVHRKTVESEQQVERGSVGDARRDNTDTKFKVS